MARINDLPANAALTGVETIPVAQSGAVKGAAVSDIADFSTETAHERLWSLALSDIRVKLGQLLTAAGMDPALGTPPAISVAPAISGTAEYDATLSLDIGAWSGFPFRYGVQWYRGADPIAGATGGSYHTAEADIGYAIKAEVTATGAGGIASAFTAATAAIGAVPLPSPWYDDFNAPSGAINGRALTGGGAWTITPYSGSNTASLAVLAASVGKLSGAQGSTPNFTFGYVAAGAAGQLWVTRNLALVGALNPYTHDHVSIAGGTYSSLNLQWAGASGASAAIQWRPTVAGVAGTTFNIGASVSINDRDTIQTRWRTEGGDSIASFYLNGRKCGVDYDVSTAAPTLPVSNNFGFRGNLPNTGPVDYFEIGDPKSAGMISLFAPNRIVQREADGSVIPRIHGELAGAAPAGVDYRFLDTADTALGNWAALSGYSGGSGQFRGTPAKLTPPAGGFITRVRRTDIVGGGAAYSRGGIQYAGEVIGGIASQSLLTNMMASTAGAVVAAPANCWNIIGWIGVGGTIDTPNAEDRRQTRVVANSPLAVFVTTLQSLGLDVPVSFISGGRGGTWTGERLPGTANHDAQRDGIIHAGTDMGSFMIVAGQYDIGDAARRAVFAANTQATLDDIMALTGRQVRGLMVGLSSVWGAADAESEALRRIMWQMCQDHPERYYWGPQITDLQHKTSPTLDIYHLTDAEMCEQARRMAYSWAKMRGLVAYDRSGPKLLSVTRDSASQCTVTFDLNGAVGLELLNYLTADRRGGLRFAATANFSNPLLPSGHVINAVAGTTQSVTYTFAAGSFSAGCYVSGPYGTEPFNPGNDPLIRQDMINKASMLCGIYAGETRRIPIQPYYSGAGDYLIG